MKKLFSIISLLSISLYVNSTPLHEVKVVKYQSSKGFVFRHFKFSLSPENVVLPSDKRLKHLAYSQKSSNYRFKMIDENSLNFVNYGQFEIFIPKDKFPLKNSANKYMIARMPQTLKYNDHSKRKVTQKQTLYKAIKSMVKAGKGNMIVTFEFPHTNSDMIESNIFFRTYKGEYINRVGKL